MSQATSPDHVSKRRVLYEIPGMDAVTIRRDVVYGTSDSGERTMDVYAPPGAAGEARPPAVIIVAGYPDPGFRKMLGCRFKEMASSVSWGRLISASGLAAITYSNREPAADLHALLDYTLRNAAALGIDGTRIGIWASSGNVPLALSLLMRANPAILRCAVLCYGYMLDLDGSNRVAEAARTWIFANPCEGKSIDDLPPVTPLFIARAGRDQTPHLNETIDRFAAAALDRNLPVTLVNHREAPHAFDLFHDGEITRAIVRSILEFLLFHLPP